MKRIDGPEIDEIRRDMLTGRLIRKAARVGWKNVQRRWKSRTTTARRPILARAGATSRIRATGQTRQFRLGSPLRSQARGRGVRQLSRRAVAKKRRLDLPSAH